MLLSERLPLAASLYPQAPALISHGQYINYEELHRRSDQLSHALYAEGLRPGDRLALLGDPDPQLVIALYAAVGIGVNQRLPAKRCSTDGYELETLATWMTRVISMCWID
ncbi:AMP-binding protein [Paenibacillus sp. Marseille-Q4541]|uniref:AMP-binding protein n=1 Tax=Paenibacillus sp. Marseille-Q4541 TaxID=2831522 RepID=UPI001BAAC901|nr:AMP-binding protein [Paenibacillus sp. Marseille-Q4541]